MRYLPLLLSILFIAAHASMAGMPNSPAGNDPASGHWELKPPGEFKELGIRCKVSDEFDKEGRFLILHCNAVMNLARGAGQPDKQVTLKDDINILLKNRDVAAGSGDLFTNQLGIRFAVCIYLVPKNNHQMMLYYVAYASRGKPANPQAFGIIKITDGNWRPDYKKSIWADGDLIGTAHIIRTISIDKKAEPPH